MVRWFSTIYGYMNIKAITVEFHYSSPLFPYSPFLKLSYSHKQENNLYCFAMLTSFYAFNHKEWWMWPTYCEKDMLAEEIGQFLGGN